ncbi:MAG: YlqD family protein [Clostridia bacterium]|nr:YlqD family protein [Clostridia bacterium]
MGVLTIKRPVVVKARVTENFKMLAAAEVQEGIKKLEVELQQLEFHSKRMLAELEKQNPQGIAAAKQHLDSQRQKRLDSKNQLLGKLKEIGKWANGSEIVQGTLETITELKVGDTWSEVFGVEVILCDDKIVEIRNPQKR